MIKYPFEDYSEQQFEGLVVVLAQKLLGIGVQPFSPGPDGGRDAKFVGTAERHPSEASPWVGTTIIQAKHTNSGNSTFSDSDFFSTASELTVLGKEIPRIKKLKSDGACDNYMLFANRRLSGIAEQEIRSHISTKTSIPTQSITLCGVELMRLWMKTFKNAAEIAGIDPTECPLIVSPDEIAEVVEALSKEVADPSWTAAPPTPRTSYADKNRLNNVSEPCARNWRKNYLKDTAGVAKFLADPINAHFKERFELASEEFQAKIIAQRKEFQSFDKVFEYLVDLLFKRDPVLAKNKRLTRTVVFYMYWNCDIGEEDDVATNETLTS